MILHECHYFLFTQPDEDQGDEAEGRGPEYAGGGGGVTEVVRAVAELLQHALALVRLALHVEHGPLSSAAPRHPHSWKCGKSYFALLQYLSIYHFHI